MVGVIVRGSKRILSSKRFFLKRFRVLRCPRCSIRADKRQKKEVFARRGISFLRRPASRPAMPATEFPLRYLSAAVPMIPEGIGRLFGEPGTSGCRRESVRAEASSAGAGNMNCVVRVRTDRRTLILKQALPLGAEIPADRRAVGPRSGRSASFYAAAAALAGGRA